MNKRHLKEIKALHEKAMDIAEATKLFQEALELEKEGE